MRNKCPKTIIVITIALVMMILIGEWYAYIAPHDHHSSAEMDGDTVTFSIESKGTREYKAVLFDNNDYSAVTEMYLFYDEKYASNVNENTDPPIGSPQYTEKYFLEQLRNFLSYKGMSNITFVNANRAESLMEEQITTGSAIGKGIMFACGSIPDNLFTGDHSDILPTWIEQGGSMYWVGNEIGKYISQGDNIIEVNATTELTDVPDITFCESGKTKDVSILREELSLLVYNTRYAIDGTGVEHYGYSDGTYSTVSCIGKGLGQICVISGSLCMNLDKDLSNVICSGLSDRSELIDYDSGTITDSVKGIMTVPDIHGNISLYLDVGSYHSIYGDRHDL